MPELNGTIGQEGLRFEATKHPNGMISVVLLSAVGNHVDSATVKAEEFFDWLEQRYNW